MVMCEGDADFGIARSDPLKSDVYVVLPYNSVLLYLEKQVRHLFRRHTDRECEPTYQIVNIFTSSEEANTETDMPVPKMITTLG